MYKLPSAAMRRQDYGASCQGFKGPAEGMMNPVAGAPYVMTVISTVMTTFFVLVSLPHSSSLKSMHTMHSWHPRCAFGADVIAAKAITQCPSCGLGQGKEE